MSRNQLAILTAIQQEGFYIQFEGENFVTINAKINNQFVTCGRYDVNRDMFVQNKNQHKSKVANCIQKNRVIALIKNISPRTIILN